MTNLTVGNSTIQSVYVGSTKAKKVYLGSNQIFPRVNEWIETTLPYTANFQAICYGDGKFVTISRMSNIAMWSTDGVTWNAVAMPSQADWTSVTYGNGRFVAIANDSDLGVQKSAWSTDGVTWNAGGNLPKPRSDTWYAWQSIAYGNGTFVAICFGSEVYATSTNGTSWTSRTFSSAQYYNRILYDGGRFVICAQNSDQILYGTNGTSWSTSTLPASSTWSDIIYDGSRYIVIRMYGGYPAYSTDCTSWAYSGTESSCGGVGAYGNGQYHTALKNQYNVQWIFYRSFDGNNWSGFKYGQYSNSRLWGIAYGNGTFVIVGWGLGTAYYLNTPT